MQRVRESLADFERGKPFQDASGAMHRPGNPDGSEH